ncbi:MAG: lamin tail domain-containing protein, partial [Planctomycetales bacterium]|nr:lamin tail domain-containing protein [Planctomycetales bacterium]
MRTTPASFRPAFEALEARQLLVGDSVVVFNELNYHPAPGDEALEWVELHNQMAVDIDLSGWRITGGIEFQFAPATIIAGGGYMVVAANPASVELAAG